MGQEITDSRFADSAFAEFAADSTSRPGCCATGWRRAAAIGRATIRFRDRGLADRRGRAPDGVQPGVSGPLDDPLVVPELAQFNFEINSEPRRLEPGALDAMHDALAVRWQHCEQAAATLGARPVLTGILPTVRSGDLSLDHMSPLQRYRAINEQVFRLARGSIELDIDGVEQLHHRHADVMLGRRRRRCRSMSRSMPTRRRGRSMCKMISAITVGAAANSPYLLNASCGQRRASRCSSRRWTWGERLQQARDLRCALCAGQHPGVFRGEPHAIPGHPARPDGYAGGGTCAPAPA